MIYSKRMKLMIDNVLKERRLTFSRASDTSPSAKALTENGSKPRENRMELKMAIVVKAW